MKELVSHERQKATVIAFRRLRGVWSCGSRAVTAANTKSKTRITERRRIQVFEPATGVRSQMKNEGVVAIWNLAHQRHFGLNNLLHVESHSFRIVVAFTIDHDAVRHAFDVEYECFEIAGFKRRVVKNVEGVPHRIVIDGEGNY